MRNPLFLCDCYILMTMRGLVSARHVLTGSRPAFTGIAGLALTLLVCLAGLPARAATPFFDDFESYAAGSNLHGQGGWSGWAENPGAGAAVSTSFSFSPTRAAKVTGATDLVHTFSGMTNGQWEFSVMQYIPSTSSGTNYVILLNTYAAPYDNADLNWSVQFQNNIDAGQIISDLGGGATLSMVKDQWVEIRVEINLDSNTASEFYNGQLLSTHVWQDGSGLNEIEALDLFADFSGPVYYDNVGLAPTSTPAESPPTLLRITSTGPDTEGLPTFRLDWNAKSNSTYLVQSANSLAPGATWTPLDAVTPTDQAGSYQFKLVATDSTGLASPPATFYRLVLPQTKIFSVEPAIVAPGVPVDFYILGQCFPTNVVLLINGVAQSGALYQSSTTLVQPSFTPDVAGTYRVTLLVGGVVVSSFTVTCADPLANPELVLQGPPEDPPASPSKKDFKGHVTLLKAFDDESGNSSARGHTKTGHVTLMKAFDDGSDDRTAGGHAWNNAPRYVVGGEAIRYVISNNGNHFDDSVASKGKTYHGYAVVETDSNGNDVTLGGGDNDPVVHPWAGELCDQVIDLAIPGRGLDFVWAHTYNSRIGRFNAYGTGWTFSYDVRCAQNSSGGVDVYDGTGRKDTFTLQTNGTYTCPQFFREGSVSNNTFTLTFADTGRWVFNPFDGSASAGKLISIITRNGDTMTLGYDTSGRLAQIVDDLGRTNTVGYNSSGQLASVTDFSGRTVTYQYYLGQKGDNGGAGDLKSVTSPPVTATPDGNDFPDGKTVTYTYSHGYANDAENHLLLSVIDAKGQTACTHVYQHNQTDFEFLRCTSVQHGTNTPAVFTYLPQTPAPSNQFATMRCVMNDPVGNVTEGFYDARGRCVTERDYTGRATPGLAVTDTDNRPTGQLRETDPVAWMRAWSWNNDSLCSRLYLFGGQQVQCVYQSDFDPATHARKRADLRVVHEFATVGVDTDGDGVPDTTELTTTFQYDPGFGSDRLIIIAGVSVGYTYAKRAAIMDNQRKDVLAIKSFVEQGIAGGSAMYVNPRSIARQQYFFSESCRLLPTVNKRNGMAAELFFDGYEKGLITPDGNGMAIKEKGTGADKNRTIPRGWDPTVKGLIVPDGSGMAINTKGTGADKNRISWRHDDENPQESATFDPDIREQVARTMDFVTSVTDPRGNVTTGTYDTNGNCVAVTKGTNGKIFGVNIELGLDFVYNNHGQLIAITNAPDANGQRRVDTFNYYTNGPQTGYLERKIEDDVVGITTSYEYDARGNVTRVIDPRTNDWLYTYNALDQCVRAQTPTNLTSRCATDFSYDANDNLVQMATELRDAADNLVGTQVDRASYNGQDCLSEIALAMDAGRAQTNRFVYDGNNQCVQVLGPDAVSGADPHQMVAYERDERGLLFYAITAPGSALAGTNEFSYTANGNPATKKYVDAQDSLKLSVFAYDGFDRLSGVTDPMGNQAVCFYDANDNLKVVRLFGELNDVAGSAGNVRLAESRYEYDGLDRVFRTHDLFFNPATQSPIGSGDAVSTCILAPNDECVSVTDSLGRTTSFGYDTACRLSSATDASGNFVVSVRDQLGNVTSVTSTELPDVAGPPQVFSTTYAYDHFNRCVSSSDNVGNTSTCAYDSLGHVVRETNPNGNDTTYACDLLDNCVASADYAGSSSVLPATIVRTSHATYDTSSHCLTSTDANGNTTSYAYDSLGDCTIVSQPDGTHEQLVWSPRSNLIQETDANGTTITNVYDLCDRLVHRDIAAHGAAVATTTFETCAYDGGSRLVLASNDVSRLDFHYDSFGDCTGGSQDGLAQSATYDSEGNPLSLTYPSGRVVTYAYDALDQVTNIATAGGGVSHPQLARFAYAGPGRLARIGRDNGIITRIDWDGLANPANSAGDYGWQEVSRVRDGSVASPSLVMDRTGTYSRTQSKTALADAVSLHNLALTYDPLEQLVESSVHLSGSPQLDTLYALDAEGNRQHVITNGVTMLPDYAMSSALPPGDFFMNRYTTTPFGGQSYDANGNLMVRTSLVGPTFYHYDYADRLVEVDALSTLGTLAPVATFTYDALGRRISKTTYPGVPAAPVTTQYVYDVVEYKDGEDGTMRTRHGCLLEARVGGILNQSYVHTTGLKEEIRENDNVVFTATGEAHYYHCDDLGNTLALTDAGGTVLERYAYDDYGQPQFFSADGTSLVGSDGQPVTSSPLGNPFLFHSLMWDGETGLLGDGGGDYFDPQSGRYLFGLRGASLIAGAVGKGRAMLGFTGNNPWSGGGGEMQKGTVKFFNEAKGFGFMTKPKPKPVVKDRPLSGNVTLYK